MFKVLMITVNLPNTFLLSVSYLLRVTQTFYQQLVVLAYREVDSDHLCFTA